MKCVTLNGIKRRGLVDWKGREWWSHQQVRIWSREHCAWWREEAKGYTLEIQDAWLVDFPTAYDYTKHCGPEKRILYYYAALLQYPPPTITPRRIKMNLDTQAAIIINDLDSMAQRIEALQAHPEYTNALTALQAAKQSMVMGRSALHQHAMKERFAKMDAGR